MAKIEDIYKLQIRNLDDVKGLFYESKNRIIELYNQITGQVLGDDALNELNSTSNTAIWRLWAFITSMHIWLLEFNWVRYRVHLEDAAKFAQSHSLAWYQQKSLEFQFGDTLEVQDGAIVYPVINPSNQIVKAASVKESSGILIVKIAKESSGELTALTALEKASFDGYLRAFKDAGVSTNVVSQNADVLKVVADIYYDASLVDQSTFQTNLESAINSYVQNLPFDGVFRRISLIDSMQTVTGFVDVDFDNLQASVAYTTSPSFLTINLSYETIAGYMNIDSNFPLSSNLNYISNV